MTIHEFCDQQHRSVGRGTPKHRHSSHSLHSLQSFWSGRLAESCMQSLDSAVEQEVGGRLSLLQLVESWLNFLKLQAID